MLWHGERCNLREATLLFFNQNAACPSTLLIVRSSTRVSLACHPPPAIRRDQERLPLQSLASPYLSLGVE